MLTRIKLGALRLWYGKPKELVISVDGGVTSEAAYFDRFDCLVGYWAYGSWDPGMPYRGQW
jgi:hypothetical protein